MTGLSNDNFKAIRSFFCYGERKYHYPEGHRPKIPTHRDTLLASFLKADGTPCGRANPSSSLEKHLVAAHLKLRHEGLIRMGWRMSFGGPAGKNDGIWFLRDGEKSLNEARAAKERYDRA